MKLRVRWQKVNTRGFTLLEVIISLLIMSLLAAIVIPGYKNYTEQVRKTGALSVLTRIYHGYKRLVIDDLYIPFGPKFMLTNGKNFGTTFNSDWGVLGFDQDPNNIAHWFDYYITYGDEVGALPGAISIPFGNETGIAIRKNDNSYYIAMDLNTGDIFMSY